MGFKYKRTITINADAYIANAINNAVVLIVFNSTDHADLFNGDDGDSVAFTSDSAGNTQLNHDCVLFNETTAIFYVGTNISAEQDTTIYFWYGDTANSGEESKASTYYNAKFIYHFQDNVTDYKSGQSTSTSGSFSYANSLNSGKHIKQDGGSITYITLNSDIKIERSCTILFWYKLDTANSLYFWGSTYSGSYDKITLANTSIGFQVAGSSKSANVGTDTTNGSWHLNCIYKSGTANKYSIDGGNYVNGGDFSSNSYPYFKYMLSNSSSSYSDANRQNGLLDEMWVFNTNLAVEFAKVLYNNEVNYSSFITIGEFSLLEPDVNFGLNANVLDICNNLTFDVKYKPKITFQNALNINSNQNSYLTPSLYWDLNIIKGTTTYNLKDLNIIQDFDFNASYNRKSHTISIKLFNDGNYYNTFRKGNDIELYVYTDENNKKKIFNGMITSVNYNLSNYDESYILIRGEDKGSIRLKQKLITGNREFINKTTPQIIKSLIETYAPDISTSKVYSDTEQLPYKSFTWITIADALDELAKLVNGYYYVDVNNILVFKLYEDNKPKHEISKSRIIRAQFGESYEDTFDRIYVLGGKENILENDFANEDVVSNINCIDYYYAVKVTTRAVNINKISVVCAKVGLPRYNLNFSIIADKDGEPLGQIMGTGFIDTWDIGETPDWVDSNALNIPLVTDTFWVVFDKYTNEDEFFILYHDNTTVNGHYRSEDIETWATQTGALAVKTYYGIQIVSTRTGTKQLNDYYSELLVTDENIETMEMGERTAEQKLIEKVGRNSSSLTVIPSGKIILPSEEIKLNIGDILTDEQVVTSVSYNIDDNKILYADIECIKAIDFYTAFADLYNSIRQINIKKTISLGGKSIEYIGQQETVDEPIEDITIYERDAVDDEPALGDNDFIFGVFKW